MNFILAIIYGALSYWATGELFFKDEEDVVTIKRIVGGLLFGWALIPLAIFHYIFIE